MANDYNQDMIQALRIFNRGDYHEARRKFTQLAAVKAQDPHVRLWLGAACFEIGYLEDAKNHWQTALELTNDAQLVQLIENSLVQLSQAKSRPPIAEQPAPQHSSSLSDTVEQNAIELDFADQDWRCQPEASDVSAFAVDEFKENEFVTPASSAPDELTPQLDTHGYDFSLADSSLTHPEEFVAESVQENLVDLPNEVAAIDAEFDPWDVSVSYGGLKSNTNPTNTAGDWTELLHFEQPIALNQEDVSALSTPLHQELTQEANLAPEPIFPRRRNRVPLTHKPILPPPKERSGSLKWQAALWAAGISLLSVGGASVATYLITQESFSHQISQVQQGQVVNPTEEAGYLNHRLLLGLLVAATGSTLLAILIALAATKPLRASLTHAQEATQRIAYGDFKTRVLIKGDDEVGSLGTNLNYMAACLQGMFEELTRLRDLESQKTQASSQARSQFMALPSLELELSGSGDVTVAKNVAEFIQPPLPEDPQPVDLSNDDIELVFPEANLNPLPSPPVSSSHVDLMLSKPTPEILSETLTIADDLPDDLWDELLRQADQVELSTGSESLSASPAQPGVDVIEFASAGSVSQELALNQLVTEELTVDADLDDFQPESCSELLSEQDSELEPEPVSEVTSELTFDPAALQMALRQLHLIQATVTNLTLQAQQTNWQNERARQLLQTSDEMIAGTAASFQSLQESVSRATARLATLRLLSQKGSSVIDAISQFAERTSQLAMNAAISAERSPHPLPHGSQLSTQMRALVDDAEMISSEISHLLLALQTDLPQTSQVLAVGKAQLAENWQQVQNSRQQLSQVIQALATSTAGSEFNPVFPSIPSELLPEQQGEDPVSQLTTMVTDLQ
jgi:methyl-accepting chemotaxis protein/tetratricopeptide (TPR) repeat protein